MPGGNRRGPLGQGPMTGRSAGYCAGFDRPGFASNDAPRAAGGGRGRGRGGQGRWIGGRGFGCGRGGGWGHHRDLGGAIPPPNDAATTGQERTMEEELARLKEQIQTLADRIAQIGGDN